MSEHISSVGESILDLSTPNAVHKRVLGLAWPVIAENFLETLLGLVDTALVAHLGAGAIAGVGSAQQMLFLLIAALSALSIGSSVLVAQAFGGRDLPRASQLARQSLIWSVIISIPLALIGLWVSRPFIGLFGMEAPVAEIGVAYLHVTMGTIIVLVGLLIGSGVLRGIGDTRTPLIVTAIANVINIILAYGLINGVAGLPQLGAVGSAWATFASRAVALILLIGVLLRGKNGVSIRANAAALQSDWLPRWSVFRQVIVIGVPAAIEQILTTLAFVGLSIVVAGLGTTVLAAHRITISALSFSFLPGFGFAIASTALVGQSIGAKRIADIGPITRSATMWGAIWMGAIAIILFVFAPQVLHVFTEDQGVIDNGVSALRIVAVSQPFLAVLMVMGGAMRGTGNTKLPLLISAGGWWTVVGVAYVFMQVFGQSLASAWGAFLIVMPIMAIMMWLGFRRVYGRLMAM